MSKQEKVNKRLFNKLFAEMSSIRRLKKPITKFNTIKLTKDITYLYYSKKTNMWFGFSETTTKFLYFFGIHKSHISNLNSLENSIMIDFDKKNTINDTSLGIITDNLTIYLNKNILEQKYPNIDTTQFNEHIIHHYQNGLKNELSTIEFGKYNVNFVDNIYQLLQKADLKQNIKKTSATHIDKSEINSRNLFLNSIKAGKPYRTALHIAGITSSDINNWYIKGKRGNENYTHFYETYKKIMPKNQLTSEKMYKFIEAIKSGKTEEESLKVANISQSELKKWISSGKKFEAEYVDFYEEYKILKKKYKTKSNNKIKNNELIERYIKLINEGKTNKEAFEILNIPKFKVKNWKKQGQLGNKDYKEFYDAYLKAVNKEESNKIKKFIKLINEGKNNDEAIAAIKIPKFKIKQWFNKGKNGEKDYIEFYKAYMKQYEDNKEIKIPKKNIKPTVKKEPESKSGKTCKICGRTINKKSTNTICKRCARKQRCANIVQDLLASIEPEVPFKKEDLKKLGLNGMQTQDYIWTLQEFSLIKKEKNNKYSLISKEEIESFIKESGVDIKDITSTNVKLTKKCNTCGETLEISKFPVSENNPDGYEDDCKNCKKLINAAGYLKEMINHFDYDKEISEKDLEKYYPNPFLLQAKIWSLLDNDLLTKNIETNNYTLAKKETCEEFLDKYFKEISVVSAPKQIPKIPKPSTSQPPKKHTNNVKPKTQIKSPFKPIKTKKQEQMDIVLNEVSKGKTRKEAAKIAKISLYKITHWYKEGRDGFGEDNVFFFKQLEKLEKIQSNKLKNQMSIVLKVLKSGGSKSKAANDASIEEKEIDNWIKKGKNGIKPYDSFKRKYDKIHKKSIDFNDKNNINSRKIFLKNIKEGKTRKEAAKKASIDLNLIDSWIIRGTKGQIPYDQFYSEYAEARKIAKNKPSSNVDEIKNEFINLLKEGYSYGEASRKIKNGEYSIQIKKWYSAGKKGVKTHLKFYLDCQEAKNSYKINKNKLLTLISDGFTIKEACEKLNLNPIKIKEEILKGKEGKKHYDEFYLKIIESKTSLIDINQLFKSPNHPHKNQMIDVLDLLLIGKSEKEVIKEVNIDSSTLKYWINRGKRGFGQLYSEFYQIYGQIKSGELISKYRKNIVKEINKELDEIENNNANILELLPKKIRMKLDNIFGKTDNGFAWVNKNGNLWNYSRRIKGININISDKNIYELHKKVINNNLTWGVRDLEKAKETLNIEEKNRDINYKSKVQSNILNPLSPDIKTKFPKGTKTGFAWVNKNGNYFYYTRSNKNIRIKSLTIKELYQKVIENQLEWGVIDLEKAKLTLGEKIEPFEKTKNVMNTDILTPLPEEIEKELNKFSKGTSTGFAWVSKTGKKYSYTRVIRGKELTIREDNIQKLYQKVIGENLEWGVRDLEKAKQTLNEEKEPLKSKSINIQEVVSKNILAPLPEQFEDSFKSTKTNKTGIAWVNKIGNKWVYSRRVNEKQVEIKDQNIYKLHKKVINQNLTWGIRDYEKAKIVLITNSFAEKNILEPIPNNKFVNYSKNESGFALVEKNGEYWEYMRTYNGEKIKDTTIFGLYEKIIEKKLIWGVIDIENAKKSLEIEKLPDEELDNSTVSNLNNRNIFSPLDYEFNFYYKNVKTKTGIAWVKKIGKNWRYIRNTNEKTIMFNDENIINLYYQVIENNQIWGIIDIKKAKKIINDETNNILIELPDKIKEEIDTNNITGFAWVKPKNNEWEYSKLKNNHQISIKHKDIYKLHDIIIKNKYDWGVVNLNRALETLNQTPEKISEKYSAFSKNSINKNLKPTFNSDKTKPKDILDPLPKNVENELRKVSYGTDTGFAWVIKSGREYAYEKMVDNELIIIKDSNIHELYKKVIDQNYLWGVRDSYKAKETIEKSEKNNIKFQNEIINQNILDALPEEFENMFNTKSSKTGIAWVNKIGNQWVYSRRSNNRNITIRDENICNLYEKVIKNKLTWGIRDFTKAKPILDKCNEPSINSNRYIQKTFDEYQNVINTDILAPLPEKYKSSFKKSKTSKTGIAWVRKNGDKWAYVRKINNKQIHISDSDIYKLHKKVLAKNLIWGVIDLDTAKKVIFNAQPNVHTKSKENNSSIFVTLNGNIISIEGKIKNNKVLNVLTKIYEYGDNILKMNTKQEKNETSVSIELELNDSQINEFREKIKEFGWEIN